MAKHANIYPNETELKQVQDVVAITEKGLKLVSDQIAEEDQKAREAKEAESQIKTEDVKEEPEAEGEAQKPKPKPKVPFSQAPREYFSLV